MNAWPSVSLGDLCESVDYGHTASATSEPIGPKFLRITDIQHGEVNWETVPFSLTSKAEEVASSVRPGDIVFARTGATTGKSFLIRACPSHAVFASYLIRIRPKPQVSSDYLAHFFQSLNYWKQIESSARGAAQPGVNATVLKTLLVPTPPYEEQRRIAAILDQAQALRSKRRQALAKLDTLTQSLFLEMFGDPRTNSKKLRVATIGKLLTLKSGNFLPASQMTATGRYPVYGGNGINGCHDEYMFEEPVISIGRVGAYCGAVHLTGPKSWITDNSLLVAHSDPLVSQRYLFEALKIANLNQYSSQSGQPLISSSRLQNVQLLVPAIDEQSRFETQVNRIENFEDRSIVQLAVLDQMFASLQRRAFEGEL